MDRRTQDFCRFAVALAGVLAMSACSPQPASRQNDYTQSGSANQNQYQQTPLRSDGGQNQSQNYSSQDQVLQAQSSRAQKIEVLFSAPVQKLLPDDTEGLPHQRFLLILDNGSTVLVAHDIKYAPRVPIQAGDLVTIKGEYIWNRRGGVVHWTHHSDTPRHEGGFIEFGGNRYQ